MDQWLPKWHRERRRPLSETENGLVRRVELEGTLSSPDYHFKRLVKTWRSLPAEEPSRRKPARRIPQRAEDRLGPDQVAQLCADYMAGTTTTELMRTYRLGKGAVLRLLDVNGVVRRRQAMTAAEIRKARQLYESGVSFVKIGMQLGRHHTVVARALRSEGEHLSPACDHDPTDVE